MGSSGDPLAAVALDSGALIALESPRGRALLRRLVEQDQVVVVSAAALAQVWRDGARQAPLAALLRRARTRIADLDEPAARACGQLLARTRTTDVVDAHVVLSAREHGAGAIVTSDPGDLRRLDASVRLPVI